MTPPRPAAPLRKTGWFEEVKCAVYDPFPRDSFGAGLLGAKSQHAILTLSFGADM